MASGGQCKANFAACVRSILPFGVLASLGRLSLSFVYIASNADIMAYPGPQLGRICVDLPMQLGIIYLTPSRNGFPNGSQKTVGPKDRIVEVSRLPPPSSRACQGPSLRARGLLRSPRLGPGQVRDGPPRASRRCCSGRLRGNVWLFTSIILSSSSRIAACRHPRPCACQTRATKCAQAVRRNCCAPRRAPFAEPRRYCRRSGPNGTATFWQEGPSSQCRAGIGSARKKTATGSARSVVTAASREITEFYEALRADAIASRPSSDRRGLALLIREGLAAWSCSDDCHCHQQTSSILSGASVSPVGIGESMKPLIAVLASMALTSLQEGTS